ncbi:TonB-dependent receptor [Pontibacter fetidus]|uniref:TonB-dependent receptor n=1 Tax=Pontibacter fetidus TaxID=2700082 RepID=A0A6B2H1C9_9BACT|nr:TonB-dependent receptor plug domain-containing protein [Pontibacter fetidus]NDK56113.1 TonB-dependent receptor [Pontibacter fetidus]
MLRDESIIVVANRILLFIVLAIVACPALAQQDTSHYQLQSVHVFGKPAEVYSAGSRVTTIDSAYLQTYTSSSLADALQARTPVYFKSYGVSGLSSVSFRGTNASQTAVLWNGLNIGLPTLGQSDFSTLPLSGFGDVSVQSGSAGATYGSGAIGGAVLLNSPTYTTKGFGLDLQQQFGAFEGNFTKSGLSCSDISSYFSNGRISYGNDKLQVGIGAYHKSAENDFMYKDLSRAGKPERTQDHAAQQQYGFTQDLTWQLTPGTKIGLHAWYTFTDRELQPAMGSASGAEQLDKNLRLLTQLQHDGNWGTTDVKLAYFKDFLNYTDDATNSVADVQTYQLQAEQTYTKGKNWSLRGGVNLQHFVAENDGYAQTEQENRAALFALFRYDPTQTIDLSLNLRQAFVTDYNPAPTPALGFNWKFYQQAQHQLFLKGNVSGSYRVPTLNDRFWVGAGNPTLKPEQGWSKEAGLRHLFIVGNTLLLETEATTYHMLVDDWIQWTEDETGRWRPINLQKVRAMGLELSQQLTATIGTLKLTGSAGYTYTSSEQVAVYEGQGDKGRQLMYVPRHKAVVATGLTYKNWQLHTDLNYTGLRYTTNSETRPLESFILINAALSKQLHLNQCKLILSLRTENITNTVYQTMAYRAMPPRGYTFSLRFIIP